MTSINNASEFTLPPLPVKHEDFIQYAQANKDTPMKAILEPFKQYDAELRKVFAQQPQHAATRQPNIVEVFAGHENHVKIRARDLEAESSHETEAYLMPLTDEQRRPNGSPAIVQSLKEFRTNFNVFSESALVDLDFSNVVVAGSAVVTPLLAVPDKFKSSKRALRELYHEKIAPASDVDLFLYDLTEEQAKAKIKQIEQSVRDSILTETTTVRTKNAITIASQHPVRHIQIVLRIYKSISEILTGFDVDCSCAAYDGKQVYASPRALAAYMTQINTIDLSRRSPSFENRLSKYAHRGFEVYWPNLDRSKIDPTIYERSFGRTEGLARLLILEKLPKSADRDAYLDQRRAERGRPSVNRWSMKRRMIAGNIKNDHEDEVAEWCDGDEVSDYHTFTIPYGPKFHARKIEKLLYTKDLLLNSEWNTPKDRKDIHLHRHPAFFGKAEDVFHDCCGYCPAPTTVEEEEIAIEENKIYVSGQIGFIKDDPGRQTIGSFNPLDADGWTEMAYVGNTARLCQAIVDEDIEYIKTWLEQEGNDPNTRDYTGRTPLHVAVASSTSEIVQCLIDHGARLVARLVDGRTALHLAAMRGSREMVSALLRKSEENQELEDKKLAARRSERAAGKQEDVPADVNMKDLNVNDTQSQSQDEDSDVEMIDEDEAEDDENLDATTENSIVKIRTPNPDADDKALANDKDKDEPDVYDVNVLSWDSALSPLHLAIVNGHVDVVKCLVEDHGADVLLPVKLVNEYDKSARAAILTLVLALQLPMEKAERMCQALIQLGASSAQADMDENTALQYLVANNPALLNTFVDADKTGVSRALNHLAGYGRWGPPSVKSPLNTAVEAKDSLTTGRLLELGANPSIDFESYMKAYTSKQTPPWNDSDQNKKDYRRQCEQPIIGAVQMELPGVATLLIEDYQVDPNTLTQTGHVVVDDINRRHHTLGRSLLDEVQAKIDALKKWSPGSYQHKAPIELQDDAIYLSKYIEGSYCHWSAQHQLASAKETYERDLKHYKERVKKSHEETGVSEKQAAIAQLVKDFEDLKSTLLKKGAKTFKQLHPDITDPDLRYLHQSSWHHHTQPDPKPFEVNFDFSFPALSDDLREKYIKLFEAAWRGEIKTVKELTLLPWKTSAGDDRAPLNVTTQDYQGLTTFAIAVLQGNFELATAIMEIAQAQYEPSAPPQQQRYKIDGAHDGDDSDEDEGDKIHVYAELVDEVFTIETIGEVSMQVKSHVKPVALLTRQYPVNQFLTGPLRSSSASSGFSYFGPRRSLTMAGKRTNTGSLKALSQAPLSEEKRKDIGPPRNLVELALHKDDLDLLDYLLTLGEEYTRSSKTLEAAEKQLFFTFNDGDFLTAIKLDKPHMISEIIKRTGAGLSFDQLIKDSGVQIKEKPKYYQGLSVYGRKRQDWAETARRGTHHSFAVQKESSPLLQAARYGSLETLEWFLSDSPLRCYNEFAEKYQEDKRIKVLFEAKGGFEASVAKFLSTRSQLAMHCCLLGPPTPESVKTLQYLIKTMPASVNTKSLAGITPLHIAFKTHRVGATKILIEAGADQTCRDKQGQNIMHYILQRAITKQKWLDRLPGLFDLIDTRCLPSLFEERSSVHPGSLTPLAQWIRLVSGNQNFKLFSTEVLRLMLKYSHGAELNIINGEGNTPLHVAVRQEQRDLAEIILEHDASLLLRENATGRTPFEMAEDRAIAEVCSNPPPLPGNPSKIYSRRVYFRYGHSTTNMVDQSAESFVQGQNEGGKDKKQELSLWDLIQKTMVGLKEQGKAQRRLVTLNEANEVARRLALSNAGQRRLSQQRRGRDHDESDDGEVVAEAEADAKDEVDLWMV